MAAAQLLMINECLDDLAAALKIFADCSSDGDDGPSVAA